MSHNFAIFSIEQGASIAPASLSPVPTTLILFDEDPDSANYTPYSDTADRGTVYQTLGGTIFQDFGVVESDSMISFSGTDALSTITIAALKIAYETIDTEWYFTDGYNCWKVRFSRDPKGLRYWRNLLYASRGKMYFSYEIQLYNVELEI